MCGILKGNEKSKRYCTELRGSRTIRIFKLKLHRCIRRSSFTSETYTKQTSKYNPFSEPILYNCELYNIITGRNFKSWRTRYDESWTHTPILHLKARSFHWNQWPCSSPSPSNSNRCIHTVQHFLPQQFSIRNIWNTPIQYLWTHGLKIFTWAF